MIVVTTTRQREDQIAAVKARADALGITEAVYAGAAPRWWQRLAERAVQAGGVLVLDRDAAQPLVVMPLVVAEELAGLTGDR